MASGLLTCAALTWPGGAAIAWAQAPGAAQAPQPAPQRQELLLDAVDQTQPPLRHRLTYAMHEQTPGNGAASYLIATTFSNDAQWRDRAADAIEMPIDELRRRDAAGEMGFIDELADVLGYVHTAARYQRCDWDLDYTKGFDLLLPHLSSIRNLSRLVVARSRLRAVRGDFQGAISDLRACLAMANHLGNRGVLIERLVGLAITGMALGLLQEMLAMPGAPNMYWPLTQLGAQTLPVAEAIDREWSVLVLSGAVPNLDDPTVLGWSASRWQAEGERMLSVAGGPGGAGDLGSTFSGFSALVYSEAKAAMIARGADPAQVEAMPVARVVVTYVVEELRQRTENRSVWLWLPYWQAKDGPIGGTHEADGEPGGVVQLFGALLSTSVLPSKRAEASLQRHIAALRAIETVRATAAQRGADFDPARGLVLPLPIDPITGKPFAVTRVGSTLRVDGDPIEGVPAHAHVAYTVSFRPSSKQRRGSPRRRVAAAAVRRPDRARAHVLPRGRAAGAVVWFVAAVVTMGQAAERAAANPAGVVRRYGSATTLVVARLDLERARPAEFLGWAERLFESLPEGFSLRRDAGTISEGLRQSGQIAEGLRQGLVGAGAREAVLIWSLSDTADPYPVIVIESPDAAAAERVLDAIPLDPARPDAPGADGQGGPTLVKRRIATDIVIASADAARSLSPAPKADPTVAALAGVVAERLHAGPSLGVLMSVSPDVRRVLEETLPTLGPELGGAPVTTLTRGVQWMTLGVELSAQPRLEHTLRAGSERDAGSVRELLRRARAAIMTTLERAGPSAEELRAALLLIGLVTDNLLPAQRPDELALTLQTGQLERVITQDVAPLVEEFRQSAIAVRALSNVRALVLAIYVFEDQNMRLPASLDELVAAGHTTAEQLLSPRDGARLVYRAPAAPLSAIADPSRYVIVHEPLAGPARGLYAVGFADGHAESMTLAALEELLGKQ